MVTRDTNSGQIVNKNIAKNDKFFKLPQTLVYSEYYSGISDGALILYGFYRDRLSLSEKNGWEDEYGNPFFLYSDAEIAYFLHWSLNKVAKKVNELIDYHLIKRERRPGHASRTYLFTINGEARDRGYISYRRMSELLNLMLIELRESEEVIKCTDFEQRFISYILLNENSLVEREVRALMKLNKFNPLYRIADKFILDLSANYLKKVKFLECSTKEKSVKRQKLKKDFKTSFSEAYRSLLADEGLTLKNFLTKLEKTWKGLNLKNIDALDKAEKNATLKNVVLENSSKKSPTLNNSVLENFEEKKPSKADNPAEKNATLKNVVLGNSDEKSPTLNNSVLQHSKSEEYNTQFLRGSQTYFNQTNFSQTNNIDEDEKLEGKGVQNFEKQAKEIFENRYQGLAKDDHTWYELVIENQVTGFRDLLALVDQLPLQSEHKGNGWLVKQELLHQVRHGASAVSIPGLSTDTLNLSVTEAWLFTQERCNQVNRYDFYMSNQLKNIAQKNPLKIAPNGVEVVPLDFYIPLDGPWNEK